MFRYPGSKWHESPHIVKYISQLIVHLVVPFLGSGAVWRRLMSQGREFATVHLNDLDESVMRFWRSVLDGSHVRNLRRAQTQFCPEREHEGDIQEEFERCKERWLKERDPFAWFFLRLYAVGQMVFDPCDRANIASFDKMYLGCGIERERPEKWDEIRSWLARPGVTLTNRNGLDVVAELVESAGPDTLTYLDCSYPIAGKRYLLYPKELTIRQHHELCELLKVARFRWILSMPISLLVRDIYLIGTGFKRVLLPTPHAG